MEYATSQAHPPINCSGSTTDVHGVKSPAERASISPATSETTTAHPEVLAFNNTVNTAPVATTSEDSLRSAAQVCGHDMCDPSIFAEVFSTAFQRSPVAQHHDEAVVSSSRISSHKASSNPCISPTYQKRGRFLVWPVSLHVPEVAGPSGASA